ncbi:hypothetical protein HYT23_06860 [Candidatus Pacearchaeota archaeon]|nr:hypothetical protein [Candidatus Pacearchaeota archaeon]
MGVIKVIGEIISVLPIGGIISIIGIIGYFVSIFLLRAHYRKHYDKKFRPFFMSITEWLIIIKDNPKDKKMKWLKWIANFSLFLIILGALIISI